MALTSPQSPKLLLSQLKLCQSPRAMPGALSSFPEPSPWHCEWEVQACQTHFRSSFCGVSETPPHPAITEGSSLPGRYYHRPAP